MFFLSMIPMAGSFLVWVPAAAFLALTGALLKAGILVVWGLLVIGSIDNFLSPRLVGKRARLHELLIFFSVLGGLQVFGVLGLVLGPVVVAITLALIEMVSEAHRPSSETLEGADGRSSSRRRCGRWSSRPDPHRSGLRSRESYERRSEDQEIAKHSSDLVVF